MSTIDPAGTLGELVAERPACAPVFERLRLDYCCGGSQTLAEACTKRGLEIDTVRAMLEALDATSIEREGFEPTDWRRASIAELCAHIVQGHHNGLRESLPRIEQSRPRRDAFSATTTCPHPPPVGVNLNTVP